MFGGRIATQLQLEGETNAWGEAWPRAGPCRGRAWLPAAWIGLGAQGPAVWGTVQGNEAARVLRSPPQAHSPAVRPCVSG